MSHIIIGLSLLIASSLVLTTTTDAAETPPNILLIVVDDMGYSDVSAFGEKSEHLRLRRSRRRGSA